MASNLHIATLASRSVRVLSPGCSPLFEQQMLSSQVAALEEELVRRIFKSCGACARARGLNCTMAYGFLGLASGHYPDVRARARPERFKYDVPVSLG